jgi:phosphatidylglycerophosphate synthase
MASMPIKHVRQSRHSLFLSYEEKENLVNWTYRSIDNSISTQMLTEFWDVCLAMVPNNVAPNLLTLAGLLCLLQSTVLTMSCYETRPILTTILNVILIFAYQALDAIDGKQARKTKSGSPVGELLDHICDALGLLLILRTVCISLDINSIWTQYLIINITQLMFMQEHLEALTRKDRVVEFPRYTGPGEALLGVLALLLFNIVIPLRSTLLLLNPLIDKCLFTVLVYIVAKIVSHLIYHTDFIMRDTAFLCFFFRFMSVYLFFDYRLSISNLLSVYSHGLFWTILTGDLIVSKMAKRKLHPIIPMFALLSSISVYTVPLSFCIYFYSVFSCLLDHMDLYMFRISAT